MAYWGLGGVGLVGSEYRCEQHGVSKVCQCQTESVLASIQNGFWLEIWVCVVPMSSANECNCQSLSDQQKERRGPEACAIKREEGHLTRLVCPPLPLSLGRCQGCSSK